MRKPWIENGVPPKHPLRFFLYASRPHVRPALLAILAVICAGTLNALIPLLYKLVTAGVIQLSSGTYVPLLWAIGGYFAASLGGHLLWRVSGFAGAHWATGARATGRDLLFTYLSRHSYQYFSDRFAGSLLSKIKQAADGIRDLVGSFLWNFLSFFVTLIVSFGILFATTPLAGIVLLALFAFVIPFNFYVSKKRIPLSSAAQEAETALNGATVDSITNIASVHEYAKRDFEVERLRALTLRRRELGMKNWFFGEWLLTWNGVFVHIFMAVLMLISVYLAVKGMIAPGDVVLFLATVWLIEGYVVNLSQQFNSFSETWGQITESLADILTPHEVTNATQAKELVVRDGSLSFENVSFAYNERQVFSNLSFSLKRGERVGVVGRSGAGKTTLSKLLLRHYDLQGGVIRVDDTDIAGVTKDSLRSAIAVVPQEPALFHRTIAENIAYSKPEATEEEIRRAAALAQAHEFIMDIPEGYGALVGERGVKLSGGQRQRIAIARALLKDSKILLLDEATSALDSESEALVQKALLNLMEGRTVIAIAHRLSTLRAMDRLLVFEQGQIIEDGTHDELMKKDGVYTALWNHQAGGFLGDD